MKLTPTVFEVNGKKKGIAIPADEVQFFFRTDPSFLDRAQEFTQIAPQQPVVPKNDGECYKHARALAIQSNGSLRYVEGLAGISRGVEDFGAGPMELIECFPHAWCVNRMGEVVDPGWSAEGKYYLGIPIPMEDVFAHEEDRNSPSPKSTSPMLSEPHFSSSQLDFDHMLGEFEAWKGESPN